MCCAGIGLEEMPKTTKNIRATHVPTSYWDHRLLLYGLVKCKVFVTADIMFTLPSFIEIGQNLLREDPTTFRNTETACVAL